VVTLRDEVSAAERMSGPLLFSSMWRKRQVGVISSEKAPSLMRTYIRFPFLILIGCFATLEE
jgi:hypothetical protein